MKTSSTILVAVIAAALGAYGYSRLAPARVASTERAEHTEQKKPNDHVEQDEHGADRIRISDVKLAAAGVVLAVGVLCSQLLRHTEVHPVDVASES